MKRLRNDTFEICLSSHGTVESILLTDDPEKMNWVIDAQYVKDAGYGNQDKRFGHWSAKIDNEMIESTSLQTHMEVKDDQSAIVTFLHDKFKVRYEYLLNHNGEWTWKIRCSNPTNDPIVVKGFHSWFSLAYIMFRDHDVLRNMNHSCAVFPHLGGDFTKFAAMRRSHKAPHLAIYSTGERVSAFGTYCSYVNRFLEQVSPSLDGMLYHRLSFVEDGSAMGQSADSDWIYGGDYSSVTLGPSDEKTWSFVFAPFQHQEDFYKKAKRYGHPHWTYSPVTTTEGKFFAEVILPDNDSLLGVKLISVREEGGTIEEIDISNAFHVISDEKSKRLRAVLPLRTAGEIKIVAKLDSGKYDVLVGNVLEPVHKILEERAAWLCNHSFNTFQETRPYACLPLSNQGESLGKLSFILMKNLLSAPIPEQVSKVERSAFHDLKHHWFEDGDFMSPIPLYGSFYRIYDFDYIGHVFYLLSQFDESFLQYGKPEAYLCWAAEIMCMRLDPDCHQNKREKEEAGLVGVFILYIGDLLADLKKSAFIYWYEKLDKLWLAFVEGLKQGSQGYQGAITEHFYDNAGFGLTCEALCLAELTDEAELYAPLIIANIGYSNDYRANAPDRWWEALSFMTHSLWGGLVAGAARAAYETIGDTRLLEAGYRATMAVFNCYDWNVYSTTRKLKPGEAASTYSIAAPNLNMPEISRNRFGQSIFKKSSDPLFSSLFSTIEGDDWDMGEELVAYMLGFGSTTYIYTDEEGGLSCVNGFIEPREKGWEITSYAAYPTRYVMREKGLTFISKEGEIVRSVLFMDGTFERTEVKK
ncbi:Alpha-L-rhamnosidase six-hairpin glycosidase domain-containing protein [Paenibacillus endophyticus]